ncbi:hypothetical protein TNCV_5109371 [Trichonephila clavipes]|nr:hypothetical protein TNCV_5109371 [Trichonephila clavipes]
MRYSSEKLSNGEKLRFEDQHNPIHIKFILIIVLDFFLDGHFSYKSFLIKSDIRYFDTVMSGHEGNCSAEHVNGDSTRDPDAVTRPEKIDSLPPNVHCAQNRTLQKLIRYAETRIRYQQELIDIETFEQRDTDAVQLQSYIHAKGATELDYNMKLGKLKLLFPCPVKNCNHKTTNGLNATRLRKRAAESCILPAFFENSAVHSSKDE